MGQLIDKYEVLGKIGVGAVGDVYKGIDTKNKKPVAIKILNHELSNDLRARERFKREITNIIQFDHPNIVAGYSCGEFKGRLYYVMEFVDGKTVKKLTLEKDSLEESLVLEILIQISEAMKYANNFGVIHRDIKPDNILFIETHKIAKLCDLGLSKSLHGSDKLTVMGTVVGTPHFMSPEIAEEEEITYQTDIFSLGSTAYFILTGKPPFEGSDPISIMEKLLGKEPTPIQTHQPKVSLNMCKVIEKMMCKDCQDRYQNFEELLMDLYLLKEGKPPVLKKTITNALPTKKAHHLKESTVSNFISGLVNEITGEFFSLKGAFIYEIGSAPQCWITLSHKNVYPCHAQLIRAGENFRINRAFEKAEIRINEEILELPKFLKDGDRISIGETILTFQQQNSVNTVKFLPYLKISKMNSLQSVSGNFPVAQNIAFPLLPTITFDQEKFYTSILEKFVKATQAIGGSILRRKLGNFNKQENAFLILFALNYDEIFLPSDLECIFDEQAKIAQATGSFTKQNSNTSEHISLCYLYLPIIVDKQMIQAVLLCGTFSNYKVFQEYLLPLASIVTYHIQPLIRSIEKHNNQECELDAANAIQASLLPFDKKPKSLDMPASLDIAGIYHPAGHVSGDYVDIVFSKEKKYLYFCVGDVSGKGTGASLIMATVRAYFRLLAEQGAATHIIAQEINRILKSDLQKIGGKFITMVILRWDELVGKLYYTPAGEQHMQILRNNTLESQAITGRALGMRNELEDCQKQEIEIPLAEGEIIILATDGVWEARNQIGDEWGKERFYTSIQNSQKRNAQHILQSIVDEWENFTAGIKAHHDDVTLLVIEKKAKPSVMVDRMLSLYRESKKQGKIEDVEKSLENLLQLLQDIN